MSTHKKPTSFFQKVLSGSTMIAGITAGAGTLSIPLVTYKAGFFPSILLIFCIWIYMMITGHLLIKLSLAIPKGTSYLSLTTHHFGTGSEWFVNGVFLFFYYCLMVAYFTAGAPIMGVFLDTLFQIDAPKFVENLLFALLFGFIVAKGNKAIDRSNIFFILLLFIVYGVLVISGADQVQSELLKRVDFSKLWIATPIVFTAFGFHSIIPTLTHYLNKDKKAMHLSLIIGTSVLFILYVVWQWLFLGTVPESHIAKCYEDGNPATFALGNIIGNSYIYTLGQTFGFFCITTSILGISLALVESLKDALHHKGFLAHNRAALAFLCFAPPFFIASIKPKIFIAALGIAGGFGETMLDGLIPIFLIWKIHTRYHNGPLKHALYLFYTLLALMVVAFEINDLIVNSEFSPL